MCRLSLMTVCVLTSIAFGNEPPLADKNSDGASTQLNVGDAKPATIGDIRTMLAELKRDLTLDLTQRYDNRIAKLEADVKALAEQMVTRAPTDRRPREVAKPNAGMSLVHLVNSHPTMQMTAVVNNGVVSVEPGRSLSVDVPIGQVSVQVLETDPEPRDRVLMAGQKFIVIMR